MCITYIAYSSEQLFLHVAFAIATLTVSPTATRTLLLIQANTEMKNNTTIKA